MSPPRGRPFIKGQSGNPAGRHRIPEAERQALRAEGPEAIQRLIAMSHDTKLLADPKTATLFLAANLKILALCYGKDPEPVALEEEPVTIDASREQVPRVQPLSALAPILSRLEQLGRLPLPRGPAPAPVRADATADAVCAAPASPDAGGLPPPDGA